MNPRHARSYGSNVMRLGIRTKLLSGFSVVLLLLGIIGVIGYRNTVQADDAFDDLYSDELVMTAQLGRVQQALYELRLGAVLYTVADDQQRVTIRADEARWMHQIDENMKAFAALQLNPQEAASYKVWLDAYPAYVQARIQVLALADQGKVAESSAQRDTVAGPLFAKANEAVNCLIEIQAANAAAARDEVSDSAEFAKALVLGLSVLALAIGLSVAFLLARSITNTVAQVAGTARKIARDDLSSFVQVAKALAAGDLTQNVTITAERVQVTSNDELGAMASDFNQMIDGLKEAGAAFAAMSANLRDVIGQVKASAGGVAESSYQLGQAASQSSDVVQQVAQAMQNVASGAEEASNTIEAANETIGQFGQAIDGIARGASEQARQVQAVSATASQMAAGVGEVASNAQSVASASQQAKASAELGAAAVRETVASMGQIQHVVATAASKVEELGHLGEKIGAVVETIDDIAEQTNLLALNAAIEAARAGEHGRGPQAGRALPARDEGHRRADPGRPGGYPRRGRRDGGGLGKGGAGLRQGR
jgi:methyl-accepting chemotaxis protein